jgi:glycosyltransferase involved in cell wall biosynthesis
MGIPVVLTLHQLPAFATSYLPEWLRDPVATALWMYACWFSRKFSRLIAPTKTVADLFAHRTGVEVSTISSGIDLESFHPAACAEESRSVRQKWDLPLDVPLLLHVGRLDPEKHVDRVIRAAAVTITQTNAHLLIVGDGSQRDQLLQQCRDLGIAERVHFTGFVARGDGLPELYRMASVFVTASEIETQGIVLLEAAASGLPIVAGRATCIPEVVHDGINGFLTEPGDSAAMSDSMTLLLRDPPMARKFGEASRVIAAQHRLTCTLDEHERLYRHLGRWSCIQYPVSGEWRKHMQA